MKIRPSGNIETDGCSLWEKQMADILGAGAGYLMILMIAGLMGCFLVSIQRIKKKTVSECGRVCSLCGVFAMGEYLLMLLMNKAIFGADFNADFSTVLHHALFDGIRSNATHVHGYLQVSMVLVAVSGLLMYFAVRKNTDEKTAWKGTFLFYMLPGMEICFLPGIFCLVPLSVSGAVFLLRKKIHADKIVNNETVYAILCILFAIIKSAVLYVLAVGV